MKKVKKVKMNKVDSLINTVLSNKGELKVLPTKLVSNKTIWRKVIVEACGWANKYDAYKFFKQVEKGEKTIALAYLCYNYSKHIVKYAEKVYNCYGEKLNKKDFLKNIYILENPLFHNMFNAKYNGCVEDCGNFISWNEVFAMGKKFDMVIMNPPYAGKGDPLFMKIAKVVYDNCLSEDGKVVSVNPTSVVDNTYDGVDDHSKSLKKKYVDNMKVESFEYSPEMRTSFDANIGTEICVVSYSKNGKHTLHDDYVRGKRFGEQNWKMRKSIIGKVNEYIAKNGHVFNVPTMLKWLKVNKTSTIEDSVKSEYFGKNICVLSYIRGHVSDDGGHKWDWTTLQSELTVANSLCDISQYAIPSDSKVECVNLIKWFNTDIIGFGVNHYKTQMTNNEVLFKMLPCPPPTNGDYSDEVLMKHFNLTKEEMDWIHSEMKNFGWKVNKGMTEAELMKHIEELNK